MVAMAMMVIRRIDNVLIPKFACRTAPMRNQQVSAVPAEPIVAT